MVPVKGEKILTVPVCPQLCSPCKCQNCRSKRKSSANACGKYLLQISPKVISVDCLATRKAKLTVRNVYKTSLLFNIIPSSTAVIDVSPSTGILRPGDTMTVHIHVHQMDQNAKHFIKVIAQEVKGPSSRSIKSSTIGSSSSWSENSAATYLVAGRGGVGRAIQTKIADMSHDITEVAANTWHKCVDGSKKIAGYIGIGRRAGKGKVAVEGYGKQNHLVTSEGDKKQTCSCEMFRVKDYVRQQKCSCERMNLDHVCLCKSCCVLRNVPWKKLLNIVGFLIILYLLCFYASHSKKFYLPKLQLAEFENWRLLNFHEDKKEAKRCFWIFC